MYIYIWDLMYIYIYIHIKYWFDIDSQYPLINYSWLHSIYICILYIYSHYIYIYSHIYTYILLYIYIHTHTHTHIYIYEIPCGSDSKESACNVRDPGSVLGLGRSPGEGNGNPLQYSYLENPMDRGAWWAVIHGVSKSRTQMSDTRMHTHTHTHTHIFLIELQLIY